MTLKLTLDKVHQMVERAIEEKGADYIYPNAGGPCSYVDFDYSERETTLERGCIVGHIFIDELKLDMLKLSDSSINEENAVGFLGHLARESEIEMPDNHDERQAIWKYLSALQQSQDNGRTWGQAHEMAKLGLAWNKYDSDWEEYDM